MLRWTSSVYFLDFQVCPWAPQGFSIVCRAPSIGVQPEHPRSVSSQKCMEQNLWMWPSSWDLWAERERVVVSGPQLFWPVQALKAGFERGNIGPWLQPSILFSWGRSWLACGFALLCIQAIVHHLVWKVWNMEVGAEEGQGEIVTSRMKCWSNKFWLSCLGLLCCVLCLRIGEDFRNRKK